MVLRTVPNCVLFFVFLFITNKVENNDGVMSFLLKGNSHIGAYNIVENMEAQRY